MRPARSGKSSTIPQPWRGAIWSLPPEMRRRSERQYRCKPDSGMRQAAGGARSISFDIGGARQVGACRFSALRSTEGAESSVDDFIGDQLRREKPLESEPFDESVD